MNILKQTFELKREYCRDRNFDTRVADQLKYIRKAGRDSAKVFQSPLKLFRPQGNNFHPTILPLQKKKKKKKKT